MDLSDWRARIDAVDEQLVDLFNKRMEYVLEIGKIKRARGQAVRDEEREKAILERLIAYNQGPMRSAAIAEIFARIIQEARDLEEEQ